MTGGGGGDAELIDQSVTVSVGADISSSGGNGGGTGWRHAFGDTTPLSHHAFTGSDAYTIADVPIAEDAAVIKASVDLDLSDTSRLCLSTRDNSEAACRRAASRPICRPDTEGVIETWLIDCGSQRLGYVRTTGLNLFGSGMFQPGYPSPI